MISIVLELINMMNQIIKTMYDQITIQAKMTVGANTFVYDNKENSLTFKGSGANYKRNTRCKVIYDDLSDTYIVELIKINMRAKEPVKLVEKVTDVYTDVLSSTIMHLFG